MIFVCFVQVFVGCKIYWIRIVARKFSIRGFYVFSGGLDVLKFYKNCNDLQCFIIKFGGLGASFGGLSPHKPPVATGLSWMCVRPMQNRIQLFSTATKLFV